MKNLKTTQILVLLLFISFIFTETTNAQRWKKSRWEMVGGVGTTYFMGDLGGGNGKTNGHFLGLQDLDFKATRPSMHAALRYKLFEVVTLRTSLSYGIVSANDALAGELGGRKYRNLHFSSPIFEAATIMEIYFIKEKIGSRYAISNSGIRNLVSGYFLFGVAPFYFEPSAKDKEGKWVKLRPLNTEGQGIVDGLEPYSNVALAYPIGIGLKYNLSRTLAINVEVAARYTNTDYIDDASDKYFNYTTYITDMAAAGITLDKELVDQYEKAVPFTDRHLKYDFEDVVTPYETGKALRGNPKYVDTYTFVMVSVIYKLVTKKNGLPKFR